MLLMCLVTARNSSGAGCICVDTQLGLLSNAQHAHLMCSDLPTCCLMISRMKCTAGTSCATSSMFAAAQLQPLHCALGCSFAFVFTYAGTPVRSPPQQVEAHGAHCGLVLHTPAPHSGLQGVRCVLPHQQTQVHPTKFCRAAPHPQHRTGSHMDGGGRSF